MKIITLTGHKQSGKWRLANKWGLNENVSFINPYTDSKRHPLDMIYLDKDKLSVKIDNEPPIVDTVVTGHHYTYFKSQLVNDFNILVLDDLCLQELEDNLFVEDVLCGDEIKVIKVWVDNPDAEKSERVSIRYSKSDYDYIYNVGLDEPDEFLEQLAFDVELVQQ